MDIAERSRAEGTLKLDKAACMLAQFLDDFGEGLVVVDRDWQIVIANSQAIGQGVVGDNGFVLGQELWCALPQLLGSPVELVLRNAMADRAKLELELQWPPNPGAEFIVRLFPINQGLGVVFRDVTAQKALREKEREQARRLDQVLDVSDLGVAYLDLATKEITLSGRAAEIFGVAPLSSINQAVFHASQKPEYRRQVQDTIRAAIESGEVIEVDYRLKRPAFGDEVWLMSRTRAQYDAGGRAVGLLGVVVDISKLKAQEAQIHESEARFRAFANSAPANLWVTRADRSVEFINQAAKEFYGVSDEDLLGCDVPAALIHPDDLSEMQRIRLGAWSKHEAYETVTRLRHFSGDWRWVRAINRPRYDKDGQFLGYVGVSMDITEMREADVRQRLLVDELNHRVKNTLATVQSIAQQTIRPGLEPEIAREKFADRLMALSAAHNVINRENWTGADVIEIAGSAMQPHNECGRIRLRGPAARLAPNIAVGLAIALQELATNSAKHGALSRPGGQADLVWRLARDRSRLRMKWRERGGPTVRPPGRRGFGMRLLTQGLAREFGVAAELNFRDEGLTCTLTIPTGEG